jgi:hypothetical protein
MIVKVLPIDNQWNNGMVSSGSQSLRLGEKNGILGMKSG